MLAEFCQRLRAAPSTPEKEFVVVTARRKLLVVEAPLEAADLLSVPN